MVRSFSPAVRAEKGSMRDEEEEPFLVTLRKVLKPTFEVIWYALLAGLNSRIGKSLVAVPKAVMA